MIARPQRIAIAVPSYGIESTASADAIAGDLASVLSSCTIEIVRSIYRPLPEADIVLAKADDLISALESDKTEYAWFDGDERRSITLQGRIQLPAEQLRRIVLFDTSYASSLQLLDRYRFAAAILEPFGDRRLDGLRSVGCRIGAREVKSFSRAAHESALYTTLEHDECPTSGALLGRYLLAYDPDK